MTGARNHLRKILQVAVVVAAAAAGIRFAHGLSLTTVEKYCPMGGLATTLSLVTRQRFSCATGEFNFSLLVALLALTLVARKSFCSWLCPVGTVSEYVGRAAAWLRGKKKRPREVGLVAPPRRVDSWLRLGRFAVLAAILYFTFVTAELIFRPFCPYYVMFSLHGHEVQVWSYAVLAVFLVGVAVLPMVWCRYLCPLGGALWPFSRVGWLRIRRDAGRCTDCGRCERACPQSLPVAGVAEVTAGECTLCLECSHACPVPETLTVRAPRLRQRMPAWGIAGIVGVMVALGMWGGNLISVPSYAREYGVAGDAAAQRREATFTVQGVRCVDTAKLAATAFDGIQGVHSFTAYASRNRVVVGYDASVLDVSQLVRYIEGPVYLEDQDTFVFHVYKVLEIEGTPVAAPDNKMP